MNLTRRSRADLTPPSPLSLEGEGGAGQDGEKSPSPARERGPGGEVFLAVLALTLMLTPPARAAEPLPWWQKLNWTWVAAGLAVGSATAAIFAGVHADELEDRYHDALATSRETPQPATTVLALGDRARGQATLSSALWGVAGICAITGGVLAWLELTAPDDHGEVFVAPVPMTGGAGLTVGGSFP